MKNFNILEFRNLLLSQSVKSANVNCQAISGQSFNTVANWFDNDSGLPLGRIPNITPNADAVVDVQTDITGGTVHAVSFASASPTDIVDATIITSVLCDLTGCTFTAAGSASTLTSPAFTFTGASIVGSDNTIRVIINGYSGQLNTGTSVAFGPWVSTLALNAQFSTTTFDAIGLRVTGNLVSQDGVFVQGSGAANAYANVTGNWTSHDTGGANFNNVHVAGTTNFDGPLTGNGNSGSNVFTGFVTFMTVAGVLPTSNTDTYTAGWKAIVTDMGNLNIYPTTNVIIPTNSNVKNAQGPYGYSDALITPTGGSGSGGGGGIFVFPSP